NDEIEIARRPAVRAGVALTGQADLRVVVDAGRDVDLELAGDSDRALATTLAAGIGDDGAVPITAVTNADVDELPEQVLVNAANLTASAATHTGDRLAARLDALAAATLAGVVLGEGDLALDA